MRERLPLDPFEQAVTAGLRRFVEPAVDRRTAAEIADLAMRPRGVGSRVRNAVGPRHYLLLGVAALFLVPAVYVGAVRLAQVPPDDTAPVVPLPTTAPVPAATIGPSTAPGADALAILVRRIDTPEPGLGVFAVRADGSEALVRAIPDTLAGSGRWTDWGRVSTTGWIALTDGRDGPHWPVTLLDLRDTASEPWVLEETDVAGIGPRWSTTGLLAAPADATRDSLVVADPATRTTRLVSLQGYGLVGGGPYIVWSADGAGFVVGGNDGRYTVVPLDGGAASPTVGAVSDPNGTFGPAMATLRLCIEGGEPCPDGQDGRLLRLDPDGASSAVWRPDGPDRPLAARFGDRTGEYWLTVDHDGGRQVAVVHVLDGVATTVATVNRAAAWTTDAAPTALPDGSVVVLSVGFGDGPGAVVVPGGGGEPTLHAGMIVGFTDATTLAFATSFEPPALAMPASGEAYRLPTVEQLIVTEQDRNPGRVVLGSGSHDAVAGDTTVRTSRVPRTTPGEGEVYLDCIGPSAVTVTSAGGTATSPCLTPGSYVISAGASGPVIVTASGDTSWRVVIYGNWASRGPRTGDDGLTLGPSRAGGPALRARGHGARMGSS